MSDFHSLSGISNRKRLLALLFFFSLVLILLIGRLGYIQLVWGVDLQRRALDQWTRELDVFPIRGAILDRNGKLLAQSATTESIAARPARIDDPASVARKLAPILEMDETLLYKRLSDKSKGHVWIKRQADRFMSNQVRELNIPGIDFTEEPRRFYPNRSLAAHILGFTMRFAEPGHGIKGQEGVELFYDRYLRGLTGSIVMETDLHGRELPSSVNRYVPPVDGLDLVLTIDLVMQHFVEREIANAVAKYNPLKVYAIVMDPDTGEILALGNYPEFDPNEPPRDFENFEQMQEYVKNFSVKDNLEPGSIFKLLTASAALEHGVSALNSTYYCPGYKIVDGQRIRCWKEGGHGSQTFAEVIRNSCNPAFMEMALEIGLRDFYNYMALFGLGAPTGIDVLGEERGILIDKGRAKTVDLARMSFGHAVAVTPLQLINSVAAIVNGGYLMRPHLAKAIYANKADNGTDTTSPQLVKEITPFRVRRVISEEAAGIMRKALQDTVTHGSGRNAYLAGFRVGGKTGTAQKYGPTGQIMEGKNISSFIGFAPADDPEIIVLFMVDEPQAAVTYGSVIAAPHVGRILEDSLKYMGIEPVFEDETQKIAQKVEVPDVEGLDLAQAAVILKEVGLNYIVEESGTVVKAQVPRFGAVILPNSMVLLYLGAEGNDESAPEDIDDLVSVPDVIGKSIREANNILVSEDLTLRIEGQGIAYEQVPEAGTMVEPETVVTVRFRMPVN
jgi:stage V sporulation protein D (sporulation-specific penicillin-binding protein)